MNLSSANRALHLFTRLLDTDSATEPIIDLGPQKPEIPLRTSASPLPVCAPEQQGIPSRHIANFLLELADTPSLRMHSVLILRNGHLVCIELNSIDYLGCLLDYYLPGIRNVGFSRPRQAVIV